MLRGEAISKVFGGVQALDNVNIEVESGVICGLLGPNGSGKTTLVNVLTGYTPPSTGRVLLDGHDITKLSAHRRASAGIGRSYQLPRLFPSLTVRENVEAALAYSVKQPSFWRGLFQIGERTMRAQLRVAADDVLRQVAIEALADRRGDSLSIGQARRAAVARALAAATKVLILDEPAAGLQGGEAEEIGAVAAQIAHEQGLAVLLIEHNVGLVRRFCDRVTVLNWGQVIADGPPDEVVAMPDVIDAYIGGAAR